MYKRFESFQFYIVTAKAILFQVQIKSLKQNSSKITNQRVSEAFHRTFEFIPSILQIIMQISVPEQLKYRIKFIML